MPLLDYQCADCGKKFDELVSHYNKDTVACPDCQSHVVQRIYEGKCLFGSTAGGGGSSACAGRAGGCGSCGGCGCGSSSH